MKEKKKKASQLDSFLNNASTMTSKSKMKSKMIKKRRSERRKKERKKKKKKKKKMKNKSQEKKNILKRKRAPEREKMYFQPATRQLQTFQSRYLQK